MFVGGDHYPVMDRYIELSIEECDTGCVQKWCLKSVDWETYISILGSKFLESKQAVLNMIIKYCQPHNFIEDEGFRSCFTSLTFPFRKV